MCVCVCVCMMCVCVHVCCVCMCYAYVCVCACMCVCMHASDISHVQGGDHSNQVNMYCTVLTKCDCTSKPPVPV